MECDDGSTGVRNICAQDNPANEYRGHRTTHRPYRSWCKICVMGRGASSPHRKSDAQEDLDGVFLVSMDYGFVGERESEEQVAPMLVTRERKHKIMGKPGTEKGNRMSLNGEESIEVH